MEEVNKHLLQKRGQGEIRGEYRRSYTQEDLEKAMADVREGGLSINKASKEYKIPKMMLSNHINGLFALRKFFFNH